jgi:hypothetical protein
MMNGTIIFKNLNHKGKYSEKDKLYLPTIVGPATELEITFLIVKGKPCNINLASAFKDAWWNIQTTPIT